MKSKKNFELQILKMLIRAGGIHNIQQILNPIFQKKTIRSQYMCDYAYCCPTMQSYRLIRFFSLI